MAFPEEEVEEKTLAVADWQVCLDRGVIANHERLQVAVEVHRMVARPRVRCQRGRKFPSAEQFEQPYRYDLARALLLAPMSFDAELPYGEIVATTVRVVTWNTWAQHGDWQQRQTGIEQALLESDADLIHLNEAWAGETETQTTRIAECLGLVHTHDERGMGVVSRWPISETSYRPLPGGTDGHPGGALYALIDGPRGLLQTFTVMLDYPLGASARRQAQVTELCEFVQEATSWEWPTIVCGDFNANSDSDEMRSLTGKAATPVDGLVFYDAWEIAGNGTPGWTWSNDNPLAAISMYPDRRFDYVFSAWPRAGAAGHPTHCELLGVLPSGEPQLSDHYGVIADLRY